MTTWQDWAIFAGQIVLALTLWPTIRDRIRMPLWTAVPATLILAMFAVVFATLHLYISAGSSLLNTVAWAMILSNALRPAGCSRPGCGHSEDVHIPERAIEGDGSLHGMIAAAACSKCIEGNQYDWAHEYAS